MVLPNEMLAALRAGAGDTLFATEVPGGVLISSIDPEIEEQTTLARGIMKSRRAALRDLAG